MNRSIDIVTNALEYYDKNNESYTNILSKIKYYKLILSDSDIEHNKIIFYDKNKQKLFESMYEMLGTYDNSTLTWIWAWSIPSFKKNITYISKKILNYGLDIPSSSENTFLKSELITSRFRISSMIQIDLHVSIASYISKKPLIYKLVRKKSSPNEDDIIKVVTLDDIDDTNDTNDINDTNDNTNDKIKYDKNDYKIFYLFLLDHDKINK